VKQPDFIGTPIDTLRFFMDVVLVKLRDRPSEAAAIDGFLAGCAGELGNISAIMLEVLEENAEVLRDHPPAQEVLYQLARRLRERSKVWNALVVSSRNETATPS